MLPRLTLLLSLVALPALAAPPAGEITAQSMVGHRAGYRLTLDRARDKTDIVGARGVMLYEVLDACDGWATRQRFTLVIADRDGREIETASDYATYESKDGKTIRFSLTQTSQGAVSQRIAGEAEVTPSGGTVRYTAPEAKQETLPPGTLLPMLHTIRTLEQARGGQKLLLAPLFDGTHADGAQDTTTVLFGWQPPTPNPRFPSLQELGSARMRVAFFDRNDTSGGGAAQPDYEVGLRYFANGVADELKMDFGEFVVDGQMQELALLPSGC